MSDSYMKKIHAPCQGYTAPQNEEKVLSVVAQGR